MSSRIQFRRDTASRWASLTLYCKKENLVGKVIRGKQKWAMDNTLGMTYRMLLLKME